MSKNDEIIAFAIVTDPKDKTHFQIVGCDLEERVKVAYKDIDALVSSLQSHKKEREQC